MPTELVDALAQVRVQVDHRHLGEVPATYGAVVRVYVRQDLAQGLGELTGILCVSGNLLFQDGAAGLRAFDLLIEASELGVIGGGPR